MKTLAKVLVFMTAVPIVGTFVYAIAYVDPLPFTIAVLAFSDIFGRNLVEGFYEP